MSVHLLRDSFRSFSASLEFASSLPLLFSYSTSLLRGSIKPTYSLGQWKKSSSRVEATGAGSLDFKLWVRYPSEVQSENEPSRDYSSWQHSTEAPKRLFIHPDRYTHIQCINDSNQWVCQDYGVRIWTDGSSGALSRLPDAQTNYHSFSFEA